MKKPTLEKKDFWTTDDGIEFDDWTYAMDHQIQLGIQVILNARGLPLNYSDLPAVQASLDDLCKLKKEADELYEKEIRSINDTAAPLSDLAR